MQWSHLPKAAGGRGLDPRDTAETTPAFGLAKCEMTDANLRAFSWYLFNVYQHHTAEKMRSKVRKIRSWMSYCGITNGFCIRGLGEAPRAVFDDECVVEIDLKQRQGRAERAGGVIHAG